MICGPPLIVMEILILLPPLSLVCVQNKTRKWKNSKEMGRGGAPFTFLGGGGLITTSFRTHHQAHSQNHSACAVYIQAALTFIVYIFIVELYVLQLAPSTIKPYHLNYSAPPPQVKTSGHHFPPSLNDPHELEEGIIYAIIQALRPQIGARRNVAVLELPHLTPQLPVLLANSWLCSSTSSERRHSSLINRSAHQ